METKKIIQLSLIFLIIIVSFAVFYAYFYEDNKIELVEKQVLEKKTIINSNEVDNVIENLEYKSIDSDGNQYLIKSKSANSSLEDQNILFLSDVKAVINLINRQPIYIYSRYAEYNKLNYDTKFYDGVEVKYDNNNVNANNLDLLLKNNRVYIYNNILYANNTSELEADFIDFDLLTGDININMFKNEDKIKIINK
tara:strand:- start:11927 stop:12514 length:588 start_codon:yes stop_codon:yes gene_type:complete